ncbi:MAG: ABC transporter ATP-binding protein [Acutalibacteraceae bacterium]
MEKIKIKNVSFSYPDSGQMLKNINLEFLPGEFVVLCGKSGSGKTTLLRLLKPQLAPNGEKSGEIEFFGTSLEALSQRQSAEEIGFILQDTEYQAVTNTVRSELAFGLENLGKDSADIRLSVAETSSYFSLSDIMDKKISTLSGGQKQLVCLASVVAMHPKVLILDEPMSQLDSAAAETLLSVLLKLCKENAVTVILSEHRLENLVPYADRLIVLDEGEVVFNDSPEKIGKELIAENEFLRLSLPSPMIIHSQLDLSGNAPLTVSQGRRMLSALFQNKKIKPEEITETQTQKEEIAVKMSDVRFAYENSGYVLKGLNLKIKKGSFFALMGENAAGKTTAMNIMSGILPCKRGRVKLFGKNIEKIKREELYNGLAAVLPQKCPLLFAGPTVREDLENVLSFQKLSKEQKQQKLYEISSLCEIEHILDRHPYDVSGGEIQRAALAMVLLKEPKILFLDEPTKGMDNLFKKSFAEIIKKLCKSGTTVVMISHDTEFCAEYCDECALIFDGVCAACKNARDFFCENYFYTTAAHKTARHIFPLAVTTWQVIELCKKNLGL